MSGACHAGQGGRDTCPFEGQACGGKDQISNATGRSRAPHLKIQSVCPWARRPPHHPSPTFPLPPHTMSTHGRKARPHSHRPRRAHAAAAPRHSLGPLSAATLSSFRCPSRQEFLRAFGADDGARASKPRVRARSMAATAALERGVAAEEAKLQGAGEDSDEGVAVHLGAGLLDAMDRLEETPELRAIACWLDDVRSRHNFPIHVTDADLTNGIALLDVLYVIDEKLFAEVEYPDEARAPRPYVMRELDESGMNAERNRQVLRRMLTIYPWRDIDDGCKVLKAVDFNRVDTWGLAGFVVLAAYLSEQGKEFASQMMGYEEWVSGALEDVLCRGLELLGGRPRQAMARGCEDASIATSTVSDATTCSLGAEDDAEGALYWRKRAREWEKKLRIEEREKASLERRARDAEGKAEAWEVAHAEMEREVARLTGELGDLMAEARRTRGRRGVLTEKNGGRDVKTVGKAVTQLRVDNAQLRRRVADVEKRNGEMEREVARVKREARGARGARGRRVVE